MEGRLLPYCDENALKGIPLVGLKDTKLHLGNLAAHKSKSVEDLIRESVEEHLLQRSYGKTRHIVTLLGVLKIRIEEDHLDSLLSPIGNLMERRHLIAHRADYVQGNELSPISPEQVEEWIKAVHRFVAAILKEIGNFRNAKRPE